MILLDVVSWLTMCSQITKLKSCKENKKCKILLLCSVADNSHEKILCTQPMKKFNLFLNTAQYHLSFGNMSS